MTTDTQTLDKPAPNPTPDPFDQYQRAFCLSLLANKVWLMRGPAENLAHQLQYELSAYMAAPDLRFRKALKPDPTAVALIGSWNLVWGPAVWQNSGSNVADNAMYVAQSDSVPGLGSTYVVAIAATNPMSDFDWQTEDLEVDKVVDFATYNPLAKTPPVPVTPSGSTGSNGYISLGTATGVYKLMGMAAQKPAAAPGTSLVQFLTGSSIKPNSTIVFVGHSLAGALAPTLALWLKTNNHLSKFTSVLVYPTAGASPGDGTFASLYNKTFPALPASGITTSKQWNTLLWNEYDVVPHAWNTQPVSPNAAAPTLDNVAGLYTKGTEALPSVVCLIGKAIAASQSSGITYTSLRNQSLPGQLFSGKAEGIDVNVPPKDLLGFLVQLGVQHMSEYGAPALMGTASFPVVDVPLIDGVSKDNLLTVLNLILEWSGKKGCGTS